MARKTPLVSGRQISDINLTPLMDLTFILLITFIITFPLIEQGIPINLPRTDAAPLPETKAETVSIDGDGVVYLNDVPVRMPELRERLVAAVGANPECSVMLRADERIPYGDVVAVLRVLREVRVSKMALVTQPGRDERE